MHAEILTILLAGIEGLGLFISPCILPILPIILSASLDGGKKRPIDIIIGFVFCFSVFTFFSKKIVQLSGLDPNLIRNMSFGLLILLGLIMISTYLSDLFGRFTQFFSNIGNSNPYLNQSGLLSGLLFGALVGLIWTPCAGPILAAVIVQSVIQKSSADSFFVILAFALGVATPMLLLVTFGRKMVNQLTFIKKRAAILRKILGIAIILSVLAMIFSNNLNFSLLPLDNSSPKDIINFPQNRLINSLQSSYPAPEITGIQEWINSDPILLKNLKDKVILIDFWAYSCINCVRTLPFVKEWYKKYHDKGLVIIGVHSPEFDFEKDPTNVKDAVKKYDIKYPVALDNRFETWQDYRNLYWPAQYLIDKDHKVVYQKFGEGDDEVTEHNIQVLLGVNEAITSSKPESSIDFDQTPETYLGFSRNREYHSPEKAAHNKAADYTYPNDLNSNAWALKGNWTIMADKIISNKSNNGIKIHFNAGKVFAVMGTHKSNPIEVEILLNNKPLNNKKPNKQIKNKKLMIKEHTLYSIIELEQPESGVLELIVKEPGLEIYTFTFGN